MNKIFLILIFISCSKTFQITIKPIEDKIIFQNETINYNFQYTKPDSPIFIFFGELNLKELNQFLFKQNYFNLDIKNFETSKISELIIYLQDKFDFEKKDLIFIYNQKDKLDKKNLIELEKILGGIVFTDGEMETIEACLYKTHFYFILNEKSKLNDFAERNSYCNSFTKLDYFKEFQNFDFGNWLNKKNKINTNKIKTKTLDLLFFGDSLSISFVWNFTNQFNEDYHFKVDNFGKVSSGLVISTFDWNKEIDKYLDKNYNEAFILIGANDDQKIIHGFEIFSLGDENWNFEYSYRLKKLISKLKEKQIEPNFILLPTVRDKNRNLRYTKINSVIKKLCNEEKISCFEIDEFIGIKNQNYSETSIYRGKILPMRQADGIHLIPNSSKKISIPILKKIFSKYEFEE